MKGVREREGREEREEGGELELEGSERVQRDYIREERERGIEIVWRKKERDSES